MCFIDLSNVCEAVFACNVYIDQDLEKKINLLCGINSPGHRYARPALSSASPERGHGSYFVMLRNEASIR